MKTIRNAVSSLVIGIILLYSLSFSVYASEGLDLNGIEFNANTTTITEEVKEVEEAKENIETIENEEKPSIPLEPTSPEKRKDAEDTAKAIGDIFSNAGPDAEAVKEANEFIRPFAVILNKIMAIILGVTGLLMMFVTVLDLLYMAFPPVRDLLDGGMSGGQQMQRSSNYRGMYGNSMRGQMGMPGSMAMDGGMGIGDMQVGRQQQKQAGGGLSALGRWVSDEAMAACMESGGGPMAAMNGQEPGPIKSMLFSYMKKRSMFLILFGICAILFTSTVFTDLGVKLGTYIMQLLMGIGS